jgi:TolB protein
MMINPPELNALAQQAFGVHGRYHVVATGYAYDIRFTELAPTEVRVDITRGLGQVVGSQVVTGAGPRNALLRAADVAVEKTNGLGLRGFFASSLAWVGKATGHDEIYTSDLFFGSAKQVTHDHAIAFTPRWSPDGTKIIYTSFYHSGSPDIFVINNVGGAMTRTTFASFRGSNSGARFSPDGQQVVMVLSGEGNPEIYVSNAEGRAVSRRTRFDSTKASPCWSPDGGRIVFASGNPSPQLYVMAAAGGPMQRLASISSECSEPDWSRAKPNLVAFTAKIGGNYQIAVYDFSTSQSHVVSKASFDAMGASWLPDGRHLVYTASSASTSRLCILDTETGKSTPISPSSFGQAERGSVWSP